MMNPATRYTTIYLLLAFACNTKLVFGGDIHLRHLKPNKGNSVPEYCEDVTPRVRLWTMDEVQRNTTACNIVFYNRVYYMDTFQDIHKGGKQSIVRNCGNDATWLFENLQCIPSVPDHFEGMLRMCDDFVVGVLKGTPEDPCYNVNYYPPEYVDPDFEACDVFENITLADLPSYASRAPDSPADGRWTMTDVFNAQQLHFDQAEVERKCPHGTSAVNCFPGEDIHCYTVLHDWVFDLGMSPLDGSDPFYKKHGNGEYPHAILKHCGFDMTGAFEATTDANKPCTPDHTLGGMNVLSGYVVGVLKDSKQDNDPEPLCDIFRAKIGMNKVFSGTSWKDESGCPVVVLDKVYDLGEFKSVHWGGSGSIGCRKDLTRNFLSKSWHIPLFHLGSIQRFQIGVLQNGVTDPCGNKYDAELDF